MRETIDNNITDLELFNDSFNNFKSGGGGKVDLSKIEGKIKYINDEIEQFHKFYDDFKVLGNKIDDIKKFNKDFDFIIERMETIKKINNDYDYVIKNMETIKEDNLLEILKIISSFIKDKPPEILIHNLGRLEYLAKRLDKRIKRMNKKSEKNSEIKGYKNDLYKKISEIEKYITDTNDIIQEPVEETKDEPVEETKDEPVEETTKSSFFTRIIKMGKERTHKVIESKNKVMKQLKSTVFSSSRNTNRTT